MYSRKKIKVPGAQHVQLSKFIVLQQQKEKIHQETMDYKGKVLKLQEEKQSWEVERLGLISHISVLNTNQMEEEEVLEELMSRPLIQNEYHMNESSAKEMPVTMLHINLIQGEIKELKEENHMLKQ